MSREERSIFRRAFDYIGDFVSPEPKPADPGMSLRDLRMMQLQNFPTVQELGGDRGEATRGSMVDHTKRYDPDKYIEGLLFRSDDLTGPPQLVPQPKKQPDRVVINGVDLTGVVQRPRTIDLSGVTGGDLTQQRIDEKKERERAAF